MVRTGVVGFATANVAVVAVALALVAGAMDAQFIPCAETMSRGDPCVDDGVALYVASDSGPLECLEFSTLCNKPDGMLCTPIECTGLLPAPAGIWQFGLEGQSCDAVCLASGAPCNDAGNNAVQTASQMMFLAETLFDQSCANVVSSNPTTNPSISSTSSNCAYPNAPMTSTCAASGMNLRRFCCCGASADCVAILPISTQELSWFYVCLIKLVQCIGSLHAVIHKFSLTLFALSPMGHLVARRELVDQTLASNAKNLACESNASL
ncbi:hypothetical protein FVE85_3637 [Porphyridium purpureum]|uniref:Uncharacterized protein n=1 Tax=Porphyridium purpureum TaxID=35688 RepID=A0A5J4YL51_PORPP|nr:hypothetical protein FVE85_3637 [Porphyridium purpureum]|eukprot:POR2085..scf249_10